MRKKYFFLDATTDEPVEMELDFEFVFENQDSAGFLRIGDRLLKRDVRRELEAEPLRTSGMRDKIGKCGPVKHSTVAGGVDPSQVPEAREHYAKVHPGISFRKDGTVDFGSRGARKAYLKAAKLIDNNGGYGD